MVAAAPAKANCPRLDKMSKISGRGKNNSNRFRIVYHACSCSRNDSNTLEAIHIIKTFRIFISPKNQ